MNIKPIKDFLGETFLLLGFPKVLLHVILPYCSLLSIEPYSVRTARPRGSAPQSLLLSTSVLLNVPRSILPIRRRKMNFPKEYFIGQYGVCLLCGEKICSKREIRLSKMKSVFRVLVCSYCEPFVREALQHLDDSMSLYPLGA